MKKLEKIKKLKNFQIIEINEDDGLCGIYFDAVTRKSYSVIFSWGGGWEHLSINPLNEKKTPNWGLMCKIKDMFWEESETCIEYHPAKKDYVNFMPYCLHIWKPLKDRLPIPPKIYV